MDPVHRVDPASRQQLRRPRTSSATRRRRPAAVPAGHPPGISFIATCVAITLPTGAAYAIAGLEFPDRTPLLGPPLAIALFAPISEVGAVPPNHSLFALALTRGRRLDEIVGACHKPRTGHAGEGAAIYSRQRRGSTRSTRRTNQMVPQRLCGPDFSQDRQRLLVLRAADGGRWG
jgi:hypothetical protein